MIARRLLAGAAAVALTGVLAACSGSGPGTDRPLLAVSTNILGDVVQAVVGEQADVMVLMPPGSDPHSFEISAQEAARLRNADLLVSNGLGLEEGVQHHLDSAAADGVPQFVAGEHVHTVEYTDDEMSGADPHLWTDPRQMLRVVDALESELTATVTGIDPAVLHASTTVYRQQLRDLDAALARQFASIPADRRALVTNHNVFGYLAERYGFTVVGTVLPGGSTLASPSASDFDDLIDAIHKSGVTVVFADAAQPDRLMHVVAAETGVEISVVPLFTESLTDTQGGAATYLAMMRANADLITAHLGLN